VGADLGLLRGKQNEIEREGARMGVGHQGPGWVGSQAGPKTTARTTTNRNQIANQHPKRYGRAIKHNVRQINMLRHDATPTST
jgi:hypothetical protein